MYLAIASWIFFLPQIVDYSTFCDSIGFISKMKTKLGEEVVDFFINGEY